MRSLWAVRLEILLIGASAFVAFLYLTTSKLLLVGLHQEVLHHGAVASEQRVCTQVGLDLLKVGGNAADAAVGMTFCVGVISMYHSGIGGGGMALVRSSNGTYQAVDFRETAPAAAHVDMFKHSVEASIHGGLASGVPGQLRGLEYIHARYGALPWPNVLRPSIDLARNGFVVSEDLFRAMGVPATHDRRRAPEGYLRDNRFLTEVPAWALDFAPNGTRLGLGDVMKRKRYADTLEDIAHTGAQSFYTGKLASQMAKAVQEADGIMTLDDIARYSIISRTPVEIDFHGHRVLACGEPASGAVVLSILKTIEGYENFIAPGHVNLSTHRLIEAMRFGYAERTSFGDPDFVEGSGRSSKETEILSAKYAAAIRSKILDDRTQNVSAYDPDGFEVQDAHGTSQISAVDKSGLAISLTTTVNLFFGSHVMVLENFSIPNSSNVFGYKPSPANYIRPHKRPLSSMSPLIAETLPPSSSPSSPNPDIIVLGAAGGSRIITAVVQTALLTLLHNLTAYAAVAAARLHDQLVPNVVAFERWYDNGTVAAMAERGHDVTWVPPGFSSASVVRWRRDGGFEAAAESRQADSAGMVG